VANPDDCICPKCGAADSLRTGAFTIESRLGEGARRIAVIVYDRRCVCGHLFPEVVPIDDKLASLELIAWRHA